MGKPQSVFQKMPLKRSHIIYVSPCVCLVPIYSEEFSIFSIRISTETGVAGPWCQCYRGGWKYGQGQTFRCGSKIQLTSTSKESHTHISNDSKRICDSWPLMSFQLMYVRSIKSTKSGFWQELEDFEHLNLRTTWVRVPLGVVKTPKLMNCCRANLPLEILYQPSSVAGFYHILPIHSITWADDNLNISAIHYDVADVDLLASIWRVPYSWALIHDLLTPYWILAVRVNSTVEATLVEVGPGPMFSCLMGQHDPTWVVNQQALVDPTETGGNCGVFWFAASQGCK